MPAITKTCSYNLKACLDVIFHTVPPPINEYLSENEVARLLKLEIEELQSLIAGITNHQHNIHSLRMSLQGSVYLELAEYLTSFPTYVTISRDGVAEAGENATNESSKKGKKRKNQNDVGENEQPDKRRRKGKGPAEIVTEVVNSTPLYSSPINITTPTENPVQNEEEDFLAIFGGGLPDEFDNASTNFIEYSESAEEGTVSLSPNEKAAYRTLEIFHHFEIDYPTQTELVNLFFNISSKATKQLINSLINHGLITLGKENQSRKYCSIQFTEKKPANYTESFFEVREHAEKTALDLFDTVFKDSENERQIYINYCLDKSKRKTINLKKLKNFVEDKILEHKDLVSKKGRLRTRTGSDKDSLRHQILRSMLAHRFKNLTNINKTIDAQAIAKSFAPKENITAKQQLQSILRAIDNLLSPKKLVEIIRDPKRFQLPNNFSFALVASILKLNNKTDDDVQTYVVDHIFSLEKKPRFGEDLFYTTGQNKEAFKNFIEHLKTDTLENWENKLKAVNQNYSANPISEPSEKNAFPPSTSIYSSCGPTIFASSSASTSNSNSSTLILRK